MEPGRLAFLGFDESFELYLAFDDFDDVLDIAAIFLLLKVFGLFQNKFVEAGAREFSGLFAGLLLGAQKRLVELIDLLPFAFRFGAGDAEGAGAAAAACAGAAGAPAGFSGALCARSASMAFAAAPKWR